MRNLEQTRITNVAAVAVERKWGDREFYLVNQILADRAAARGLARLAGFYNRVTKAMAGRKADEIEKRIGIVLDVWIVAPEDVKKELMNDENLSRFLNDPTRYVAEFDAKLVKGQGENSETVHKFRDEKTRNAARLQAICKNRVILFPSVSAK